MDSNSFWFAGLIASMFVAVGLVLIVFRVSAGPIRMMHGEVLAGRVAS
jgi:hypothetical protein